MNYIYYGQELYHHGVKGQKWGQRRWQNEDGTLTPEGRIHYGYGNSRTENKSFHLTDKQKKYLKIGAAAIVGATILGVGVYAIKSGKFDDLISKGKNTTIDILGLDQIENVKEADRKLISKECLEIADRAKSINLVHGKGNCVSCAVSGFLNGNGISCKALGDLPKREDGSQPGYSLEKVQKAFKGTEIYEPFKDGTLSVLNSKQAYSKVIDILKNYGNNAEGIMSVCKNVFDGEKNEYAKKGHEIHWKVINDTVQFFEGQTQVYSEKLKGSSHWYADEWSDLFSKYRVYSDYSILRLDNNTGIDKEALKEIVELL